jgi:arylesterase / paraoxonase
MLKWSLIGLALIVGAAVSGVGWIVTSLGGFDGVDTTYAGSCSRIVGMPGAEDIEPDYATGFAYVSSDDRWAYAAGDDLSGAIFRINMNDEGVPTPVRMNGTEGLTKFHPHGISFYQDGERKLLFVISHRALEAPIAGHDIYVFEIVGTTLILVERFEDIGFKSPNDLAAVGPRQFYFTNDRRALEEGAALSELLLGLEVTDVSYFDGSKSSVVADGLAFANGVKVSADGLSLYATAFRGGVTNIYARDPVSNSLEFVRAFETANGPDNITLADDASLWVTAHVSALASTVHAGDPTALAPVQVFRIDPISQELEIRYEDNGALISAASVAVPFGDRLFIGSVYQDWVLACEM